MMKFAGISATCEIFGIEKPPKNTEEYLSLLPDDAIETMKEHIGKAYASGVYEPVAHRIITRKGDVRWVQALGRVIRDATGKIIGLSGGIIDITKEKYSETERVDLEAQLRHSQKMDALGTLAGGIAHDFNNILQGIIGMADLALLKRHDPNKITEYLEKLQSMSERGRGLVQQILGFARRNETEHRSFDLISIVNEVESLMKASLPSSVTFDSSVGISAQQATVFGNATQVHQVVVNLCTNASHAISDTGTITIRLDQCPEQDVEALNLDTQKEYFRVRVRDNGCGIPEELQDRIFEPFFTTREIGKGTGLGLSMALGIMQHHGGGILMQSTVSQGTTFTLVFPKGGPGEDSRVTHRILRPATGASIVVVDDEALIVELTEEMLREAGYVVSAFNDPRDALAFIQDNLDTIDLVLTDMTMPYMTGDVLAAEIPRITPRAPIGSHDRIQR